MKILIAEDNFVQRKLLINQLSSLGEVDMAANGKEAVMAVELAVEEHQPYDLIFLDIMMPENDGIQALKKIRKFESQLGLDHKTRTKIIMVTAHSDRDKVVTAGRLNCDSYLIKPVTKPRLFEEIRKLGFDIPE
jgi:two-component system chemotaxis response regulator CheY